MEGHSSSSCFLPLAFGFAPAFPLGLAVFEPVVLPAPVSEDVSPGEYRPRPELLGAGVAGPFAVALAAAPLWDHDRKRTCYSVSMLGLAIDKHWSFHVLLELVHS